MPAVAVVTLIGVAVLVAVLAGYLIWIALILWHVVRQLNVILAAVAATSEESAPIGAVTTAINADLGAARRALEEAAANLLPQERNGRENVQLRVR